MPGNFCLRNPEYSRHWNPIQVQLPGIPILESTGEFLVSLTWGEMIGNGHGRWSRDTVVRAKQ